MGVAPEAQILNMKVFKASGGASFSDVLAALEDCIALEVDAVNMSLGSTCGFIDYESQDEWTMNLVKVFNRVGESGISMAVAVGNDYSASYSNAYGGGLWPPTRTTATPANRPPTGSPWPLPAWKTAAFWPLTSP